LYTAAGHESVASIANDDSASNNSLGELFFCEFFFLFSFLAQRQRVFGRCGLVVDRHADQQKQVARLVPCGMVQLQPGCQSRNEVRLSCCASIANDVSASNNSLGELFFCEFFFLFSFLAQRQRVFGRCGLVVDRHADQQKQVARLVPCGMVQLQP
jgi:hypothetical protein